MITRISATRVSSSQTPTCNRSKSRATMQQHKKITKLATTSIPAGQPIAVRHATTNRTATTMRRCSLAALQVLVLACALPPPLQPLLPTLLLTPTRWSFAVEALPITSKPIEGTAENLAWQAWLMLPPEQKQLEKSRKVTPKSIFSLPFRDCPPGHQLFQSRCIPTVNINQSDLLAQQVLGLLVGSTTGGMGGTGSDNAYEFDYEDEEYGLGFGEGEPVVMYESPQPFSGTSAAGSGNAPARDEPLKFNLFEQKYPTSDYETDASSSTLEGSGGARPLSEPLTTHMTAEGERVGASANDRDDGATFFNSSQFLDAVQGFFQRHTTTSDESTANTTMPNATTIDQSVRIANATERNTDRQGLSDLHVASSNISTFAVGDIDAIILPAVSSGMPATTTTTVTSAGDSGDGGGSAGATGGNLEPQRISLIKDDNTVQLVTTVIAQSDGYHRGGGEDAAGGDVGDLVTAAQQQHNSVAQYLRADALLPLSSAAPYITTTATTFDADNADHGTKPPPLAAKDERPRSVTQQNTAAAAVPADTDAQETSFITTTEPEGTTSFQIDETTVVEASDESATVPEAIPLLEAISKQQQLEFQKLKVEPVEDEAPIKTTSPETAINEQTTTADDDNTTIETKTIANEKVDTTTAKEAVEKSEKSVEATTAAETTTQPLTSAVALSSTIIATTTTKIHLTTTPSSDRFRSSPAAAVVAPIRIATDKQVSDVVNSATAPATNPTIGEETAAPSIDVVSDVPRSGNSDLVNVAAASSIKTSDTKNDSRNKNKNNKKPPVRIAASAKATMAASEINIEQELRMINELVKGKRQLAALKMAALKATTTMTQAATSTQKTTASEPKLEVKKSGANAAENEQNARGVAAVEVRHDVDEATTTTTTQVTTITAETTTVVNSPLVAASGSENEVLHTTATTTTTDGTKAATQKEATAKMESGSQPAETTTVENTTAAEALSKIVELATTTATATAAASAEPDFEAEATAPSVEATGATLWSRIMPLFGFGVTAVETGAKAGAAPTAAATTTAVPAAEELAGGAAIGSISSSNRFSGSNVRSSISGSISDISSIGKNVKNNNLISNNNNKHFDGPIRRNSKIIRIDQLSANSVGGAAAAATTNTLEEEEATATATATTTAMANTKTDSIAIAPEQAPAEQSSYWWLPAGWRSQRDTNDGQQPLLFRLWSAFPESQMKAKVRT
ncbi:PREDICTED: protein folded gastrulation-like [Rhagoletis zephyria]|uniref:protein folded gastrulation-like n=1 Tax=Rhagoletis zephyria TaxID=28612 RepID=UPI0008118370|nr:PREDICTED: protein folded gastrulation-like [Rhagoletis zephyria]